MVQPGGVAMVEEQKVRREIRFCPNCFQQEFDISGIQEGTVYCEVCGINIDVKELVK
jgi:hypothetical protein